MMLTARIKSCAAAVCVLAGCLLLPNAQAKAESISLPERAETVQTQSAPAAEPVETAVLTPLALETVALPVKEEAVTEEPLAEEASVTEEAPEEAAEETPERRPCASPVERPALAAHEPVRQRIFARITRASCHSRFGWAAQGAPTCHFCFHCIVLLPADDGFMVVRHIVLRHLSNIFDNLLADDVCPECFLKQHVAAVFFICQDTLDGNVINLSPSFQSVKKRA